MHFTVIQIIIMFLIGYVCLYALIDRVMKCIEHCATARAYGQFKESGAMIEMDDVGSSAETGVVRIFFPSLMVSITKSPPNEYQWCSSDLYQK